MVLWRVTRAAHIEPDGEGARLFGARWNSKGIAVVYTASHLSLAALEYLVHIDVDEVPDDLLAVSMEVPEQATELACTPGDLPSEWRRTPPPAKCREIGDKWASAGEHLLFRVPSVLVPEESNVLVNPAHPDARDVRIASSRGFSHDPRLMG